MRRDGGEKGGAIGAERRRGGEEEGEGGERRGAASLEEEGPALRVLPEPGGRGIPFPVLCFRFNNEQHEV